MMIFPFYLSKLRYFCTGLWPPRQRLRRHKTTVRLLFIDWCCSLVPLSAFWCVGSKSKIEISHCEHRSANVCEVVAFLKSSPRSCHIQSCNRRQHGSIDENVIWGSQSFDSKHPAKSQQERPPFAHSAKENGNSESLSRLLRKLPIFETASQSRGKPARPV